MPHLRLLTLNTFGVPLGGSTPARLATLCHKLNHSDLDLACLQEIQLSRYLTLLRRASSRLTHFAYHPHLYAPKGGLVTLSHWPLQQTRYVLYRERGRWHTPAAIDRLLHKGILITELTVRGLPLTLVNTHLVANYNADWSPGNKYARQEHAELRQLAGVVDGIGRDRLLLLAGDFNVPRESWLYRDFVAATSLTDLLAGNLEPTFHPSPFLPAHWAQPIDYIFMRPPAGAALRAVASIVLRDKMRLVTGRTMRLSDHSGLEALVEWPEN